MGVWGLQRNYVHFRYASEFLKVSFFLKKLIYWIIVNQGSPPFLVLFSPSVSAYSVVHTVVTEPHFPFPVVDK